MSLGFVSTIRLCSGGGRRRRERRVVTPNQRVMKFIVVGTGVLVFVLSALFSFFFVDAPSSALPEPATQRRPATGTPGAPEAVATTGEATSIQVRGTTLRVGDTADEVLNTLKPADLKDLDFVADPGHADGLLVRRHYNVDGQSFYLTMGRTHLFGPDRIVRIATSLPKDYRREPKPVVVKGIGRSDPRDGGPH
jgi:hypothetical protein